MTIERYQKGNETIQEFTVQSEENPTGHMDIGEAFEDIAPDLS